MATAYEVSDGDLVERLLSALGAAQAEGGDLRICAAPGPR
ncbi:MAG: DUF1028 domain-containing protein, partial [Gemmatimonadota bacterium]